VFNPLFFDNQIQNKKENTMIQCSVNNSEAQAQRLQIKTIHRQMENLAVTGAGLSPWEARELVGIFHDTITSNFENIEKNLTALEFELTELNFRMDFAIRKINEPDFYLASIRSICEGSKNFGICLCKQ
jgi:hypothetical protein